MTLEAKTDNPRWAIDAATVQVLSAVQVRFAETLHALRALVTLHPDLPGSRPYELLKNADQRLTRSQNELAQIIVGVTARRDAGHAAHLAAKQSEQLRLNEHLRGVGAESEVGKETR